MYNLSYNPQRVNKEKVITIVIGLVVGAVVIGGYFIFKNYLPKASPTIVVQPIVREPSPTPTVSGITNIELLVTSPEDKTSTSSANINVTGKTVPGATVMIFANSDEKIASATAQGNFDVSIKLEDGENEISVTAFSQKMVSAVTHRNITLEISL